MKEEKKRRRIGGERCRSRRNKRKKR